jgi:methionine-rich copper-binding protein CopC
MMCNSFRLPSLVVIALLLVQPALAATQLLASNPQTGAIVSRHNISFWLRFNKRIENAQCSVSLQMPTGEYRTLPLQAQTASDQIEASGTDLRSGSYALNWQIQTAGDPVTRGTVTFSVR